MYIIKHGKPPNKRPIRIECRECDTIFEFTRDEARFEPDFRDGNSLVINCPICSHTIWHAI